MDIPEPVAVALERTVDESSTPDEMVYRVTTAFGSAYLPFACEIAKRKKPPGWFRDETTAPKRHPIGSDPLHSFSRDVIQRNLVLPIIRSALNLVLLATALLIALAVLFPPFYVAVGETSVNEGFHFIFGPPLDNAAARVDVPLSASR